MATRRTSDSTRSPKPVAAVPVTTPVAGKAPAVAKATTAKVETPKPAATKAAAPRKRVTKPAAGVARTRNEVSPDTRRAMIAESAYLRAERRGFAPGHETEDWVAAEREVDALLSADSGTKAQ